MDIERLLPFPVFGLLLCPSGIIHSWFAVAFIGVCLVGLGQFMLLFGMCSEPKGDRLKYWLINEAALLCSVFGVLTLQLTFS